MTVVGQVAGRPLNGRTLKTALAFAAIAFLAAPAMADSLSDMLATTPTRTLPSSKSALAIEHCVGAGMSEWFPPITLRGEGVTEVYASTPFAAGIPFLISIRDLGASREVAIRSSKGWNDRLASLVQSCA